MKKNTKIIIILTLLALFLLILAPWMDNQVIQDRVFQEKAHKDGTMGARAPQTISYVKGLDMRVISNLIHRARMVTNDKSLVVLVKKVQSLKFVCPYMGT